MHLAAFNPLTGAPYPRAPNPTEHIQTMDVIGTTLYVGGGFTRISGQVRAGAAAFIGRPAAAPCYRGIRR